ncbi:hypothetical protein [Thermococcus sp.]
MSPERIIAKLLALGADLSTRSAVRAALSLISEDEEELTDQIYVELKNKAYKDDFAKIPPEKRAVFIPPVPQEYKILSCRIWQVWF